MELDKVVDDYVSAIKNEYIVDSVFYRMNGTSDEAFKGLPRPSTWLKKNATLVSAVRFCASSAFILWAFFLSWFFYIKELVVLLVYLLRFNFSSTVPGCIKGSKVALPLSFASVKSIEQVFATVDFVWLDIPWLESFTSSKKGSVNLFRFIGIRELFVALTLCFKAGYIILTSENKLLIMQTYTAFRWFCVRLVCDKLLSNDIIIAEHFDRWAVLVDTSQAQKLKGGSSCKFNLVQHGLLSNVYSADDEEIGFELFYKIKNVTDVYCYNEISYKIFKRSIVHESNLSANYHYFSPIIKLKEMNLKYKFSILFIGNPLCEQIHFAMYRKLSLVDGLFLFYKPHPVVAPTDNIYNFKWEIIDDSAVFPKVNLVVAYPSTLAYEYKCQGVRVVEHSLISEMDALDSLIAEVKNIYSGVI